MLVTLRLNLVSGNIINFINQGLNMEETKICPECGVEYYAHITECVDCRIKLTTEIEQTDQEKAEDTELSTLIARGPVANLKPLVDLIAGEGINHKVELLEPELNIELTPGSEFGVFTKPEDTDKVAELVRMAATDEFPELKQADEQLESGKCPACGADVNDNRECPDCGLPLWFETDE